LSAIEYSRRILTDAKPTCYIAEVSDQAMSESPIGQTILDEIQRLAARFADARIRIGEIFQVMPTAPEIRSLREDVARFREQSLETQVRLGAIEGRLGI
jgi:hypothetical protein